MPARRFCALCGRSTNELYDGLCFECYIKSHEIIKIDKKKLTLAVCKNCGAYFYRGKWHYSRVGLELDNIVAGLERIIKCSLKTRNEVKVRNIEIKILDAYKIFNKKRKIPVNIKVEYTLYGKESIFTKEVEVELIWKLCPACMKVKSQVEHAILQIRAYGRELNDIEKREIINFIEKELYKLYNRDREAVILEKDEKEGINIYLSSKKIAKWLVNSLKRRYIIRVLETNKVIGVDSSGKTITKVTIRVLLNPLKVGDIIIYKGKLLLVKEVTSNFVMGLDLDSYKSVKLLPNELFSNKIKRIDREDISKACIISITPPYVQLMGLKDYKVFEVKMERIPNWIKIGNNVFFVKYNKKTYLVPYVI